MRSPAGLCSVLSLLAVLTPTLLAQKPLPEPRLGLSFTPPKGFGELPADVDRHATLRLFAAPRALAGKDEGSHTPLLRVMFFQKGGDADKDVIDGLPRTTPFRSLEDFARRGLGAKDVAKEAKKVGGFDGQSLSATGIPGDRVLLGQTIALADGDAAFCLEVLAGHADKLKKDFDAVLGSLATMPRTPALRLDPPWLHDAEWAQKDVATRRAARAKWADAVVTATAAAPGAGYKVQKAKYWTVVSQADPAFTKKAIAAAEAARDWFARQLPELTKEPPLPAVLRVFDNTDQFKALLTTHADAREYDAHSRELYFVNDRDNGGPTGFGPMLRAVLWHLCDDVDPGVLQALPRWLDNGCWEFLRSSRFDGKKFEFASGDVERGRIDYYRQKDLPIPPLWDLMQELIQPSPKDGALETDWSYTPECARLMRWFWLHDGQKAFAKPTLVADYIRALGVAHGKLGANPTLDVTTVGLSEAQQKERNSRHYKWRDAILVETNNTVIPLQVDVWKTVNEKWVQWNATFK